MFTDLRNINRHLFVATLYGEEIDNSLLLNERSAYTEYYHQTGIALDIDALQTVRAALKYGEESYNTSFSEQVNLHPQVVYLLNDGYEYALDIVNGVID